MARGDCKSLWMVPLGLSIAPWTVQGDHALCHGQSGGTTFGGGGGGGGGPPII